jgi:hypothetical protein
MAIHEITRLQICLVCNDRATNKIKPDSAIHRAVKDFLVQDFIPEDPRLPGALCDSCRIKLSKYAKGDFSPILPEMPSYKEMQFFRLPRKKEKSNLCSCQICSTFRVSTRMGYRKKLKKLQVS